MQITAVCPSCETSYRLDPSMRGKATRCPNPQCRAVFTVPAEQPPAADAKRTELPPAPPGDGRRTGLVGDMVPLLAVEPEAAAPAWQSPPPVRRPTNPSPSAPAVAPEPAAPPVVKKEPPATPAKTWESPPVRRKPEPKAVETPPETAPPAPEYAPPPKRTKRLAWVVAGFAASVALILGVGGYLVWTFVINTQTNLAKTAEDDYRSKNYNKASDDFHYLVGQFPNSDKHSYYQLMQELSDLRGRASAPGADVAASLDELDKFIDNHKEKDAATLKERAPDLAETISALAKAFAASNPKPTDDKPLETAKQLEASLAKVTDLDAAVPSAAERGAIDANIAGVRQAVALNKRIRDSLVRLVEAAKLQPAATAVREFFRRLKEEKVALPEIAKQPEISQLSDLVYKRHLEGVHYELAGDKPPAPVHDAGETHYPSLIVDPALRGGFSAATADDPVVLAVVRGVLYALDRANGRTKWAVRVGVDMTDLPVRVPAQVGLPERILVVSADAKAVTALDANGDQVWQYHLGAECLGRPLIVDQLAYLATYDGKVHEIELAEGKLLGVFDIGQHLTVGGVREPNTSLLYFAGDDFCVYALDVTPQTKRCAAILYTNHAAGSLRSAPMILSAPDAEGADADWLVLNQADGLHQTRLQAYHLPIADRDEPAEKLDLKPIPGWTSFPPYHDGEKLTMLGDAGVLGIFGIRQARNLKDPLLFPMLPENFNVGAPAPAAPDAQSRAETAEVRDRDYWLLAGGELQRLYLELTAKEGPRMKPAVGWESPRLGSPLQAAQVEKDALTGAASLILVTQPAVRQTCLATAVDDKQGEILWQRQLGFVCRGEPLALRAAGAKGPPVLIALDQGGGLFAFDPARYANLGAAEWHESDGSIFEALDDGPGLPPVLLPGSDGQSAYEIACPGDGKSLTIRHVEVDPAGGPLKKDVHVLPKFPAPLGGTPLITKSMIVLPLANGILARVLLPLGAEPKLYLGPNWSSKKTPPQAVCRLTALGPDTFLASDGGRGLTYWRWPADKDKPWAALPNDNPNKPTDSNNPSLDWKQGSLTADPVLLPAVNNQPRQVCIADVTGTVVLITAPANGHLKPEKQWKLDGQITAGPYVEVLPDGSTRIACVVDNQRLVWLDPAKDAPLWTYKSRAALVGRPRFVGAVIAVGDDSGLVIGLDPAKGTVVGKPLQLPGSTAPAASPVAFGDDRLFTPLSDGTVLLPSRKRIGP